MTGTVYQMLLDNLHITYTPDESTVRRITNEAEAGMEFIRKYCDPAATCEPGTEYGQMLCEYVLRAESGAMTTFEADFAQDILQGRIITEVNAYVEAMGYDQTE